MSFTKQLELATLNLQNFSEEAVKGTIFKVISLVVKRTPVDLGTARGNWQATVNAPSASPIARTDTSGGPTINSAQKILNQMPLGSTFYLTNNLPYILMLEYGGYPNPPKGGEGKTVGGFSRQAPQGMLRVTLSEVARALK